MSGTRLGRAFRFTRNGARTMKPKTFDAVAESRKWREETSRMLDAMDLPARLAFLAGLRAKLRPARPVAGNVHSEAVVREDPPSFDSPEQEAAP